MVGPEEWRFPAHSFILDKTPSTLSTLLKTALGTPQSEEVRERLTNMDTNAGGSVVEPIVLKLPNLQPEVFEQIYRWAWWDRIRIFFFLIMNLHMRSCALYSFIIPSYDALAKSTGVVRGVWTLTHVRSLPYNLTLHASFSWFSKWSIKISF